jgi:jumonji domain-containing protein 2
MSLDVIAPQHNHLHYPTAAAVAVVAAHQPPLATSHAPAHAPAQDAPRAQPAGLDPAPAERSAAAAVPTAAAPPAALPLVETPVPLPPMLASPFAPHAHPPPTTLPLGGSGDLSFAYYDDPPSGPPYSPLSTLSEPDSPPPEDPAAPETPQTQEHSSSSPQSKPVSTEHSQPDDFKVDYDLDGPEGHKILRLKPTVAEWNDFPSILSYARSLGAENDGCFKVVIPDDMMEPLPERSSQKAPANAYQIRQVKRNGIWRVSTVPSEGLFNSPEPSKVSLEPVSAELQKLKKLFNKNKDRQIRSVRYRVDIPAWTSKQRQLAGVPARSPIHPLKGDKLDHTKAIIPGIHTPYVYESAAFFGATFQIHAEDYRLASLNHLYKGRKIWITIPSTAVDVAEEALGRKKKCSQFMRHRAEFFFPDKLDRMGVPYRIVDQMPGETIVILPDAYHEGFSTGYTIAEAKNYAESDWTTSSYQACDEKCQLLTAIPAAYMRLLDQEEERLDLCARYADDEVTHVPKRPLDETAAPDEQREAKKIKA